MLFVIACYNDPFIICIFARKDSLTAKEKNDNYDNDDSDDSVF